VLGIERAAAETPSHVTRKGKEGGGGRQTASPVGEKTLIGQFTIKRGGLQLPPQGGRKRRDDAGGAPYSFKKPLFLEEKGKGPWFNLGFRKEKVKLQYVHLLKGEKTGGTLGGEENA